MPLSPSIEPQPQAQPTTTSQPLSSSYPALENHETECYILQSLELLADLATTPASQYCSPETGRSAEAWAPITSGSIHDGLVAPRSLFDPVPSHRYDPWEAAHSFQQVYQRTVEGQQQHPLLQPKPSDVSALAGSPSSSALVPPEAQFNQYHNNAMPQYPSSAESNDSQHNLEEPSFKRLRNTAASARFRAKKKRREQLLEQNARENQETLHRLENRVAELETENRWLKNLIMDKSEMNTRKDCKVVVGDRKGSEHKDGVGTENK